MKLRPAKRCLKRLAAGAIVSLSLLLIARAVEGSASAACGRTAGLVEVASVDERLDLGLADGRTVRLGGLDKPSPYRGSSELARAARAELAGLVAGKQARLMIFAPGTDRWGRIVADLALPNGDGPDSSVSEALLRAGYARVRPEFETRRCDGDRLAIEAAARRAGMGLWRDPAFAVLQAGDGGRLRQFDGRFRDR